MREQYTRIMEAVEDLEKDIARAQQEADRIWRMIKNDYKTETAACAKALTATAKFIKADSLSLAVAAAALQIKAEEEKKGERSND